MLPQAEIGHFVTPPQHFPTFLNFRDLLEAFQPGKNWLWGNMQPTGHMISTSDVNNATQLEKHQFGETSVGQNRKSFTAQFATLQHEPFYQLAGHCVWQFLHLYRQ